MSDESPIVWRVSWPVRWVGTLILVGQAVYFAIDSIRMHDLTAAASFVLLEGFGIWIILWRPRAKLFGSRLEVFNYVRHHTVPLVDIVEPIYDSREVAFQTTNLRRVPVVAVSHGRFWRDTGRLTRGERFIADVMAARGRVRTRP